MTEPLTSLIFLYNGGRQRGLCQFSDNELKRRVQSGESSFKQGLEAKLKQVPNDFLGPSWGKTLLTLERGLKIDATEIVKAQESFLRQLGDRF